MEWTRRTVETSSGPRQVLVGAPVEDAVISAETLAELRSERPTGLPHERVIEAVRARAPVHAVVLRGRGADGSGQFRLARELDDPELEEVGYLLARAQLRAWRPVLREDGVLAIARVELRVWELAALRSGATRLAAELENGDAWLLQHAVLNFGVGLDTALGELLPQRLHEIESARPRSGGRVA